MHGHDNKQNKGSFRCGKAAMWTRGGRRHDFVSSMTEELAEPRKDNTLSHGKRGWGLGHVEFFYPRSVFGATRQEVGM